MQMKENNRPKNIKQEYEKLPIENPKLSQIKKH
jgi:hypothetical protein